MDGYLLLVSCLTLVLSQLSETGKLSSIALWLLLGEKGCQQMPMSCGDKRTYQLSKTALNLVVVRESLEEKKFLPHRKGWVGKGAVATASGGLDEEQKEENVHTPLLPSYLSKDYHW